MPTLLRGYAKLEHPSARQTSRGLAEIKAATLIRCEYCIDLGSQVARRWG